MARKSLIILFIILAFATSAGKTASAKETFVKYSEAVKLLGAAPQGESVTVEEARTLSQKNPKLIFFDARAKNEYVQQHIAGARLPLSEEYYIAEKLFKENITRERPDVAVFLKRSLADLPRNTEIITYCHKNCGLSKILMNELKNLGFTRVHWLDGGIDFWREKGYPLES